MALMSFLFIGLNVIRLKLSRGNRRIDNTLTQQYIPFQLTLQ
jgi:hypothetical protein